jgi:hypothetical protein
MVIAAQDPRTYKFPFGHDQRGGLLYWAWSLAELTVTLCCTLFSFWYCSRSIWARWWGCTVLFYGGLAALAAVGAAMGVMHMSDPTVPEGSVIVSAVFTLFMPGIITRSELISLMEVLDGDKTAGPLGDARPAGSRELGGLS